MFFLRGGDTEGRATLPLDLLYGLYNLIGLILLEMIYQGEQYGHTTYPDKLFRVSRPVDVFFQDMLLFIMKVN